MPELRQEAWQDTLCTFSQLSLQARKHNRKALQQGAGLVDDDGLQALSGLGNLKALVLPTAITDAGLKQLTRLERLTTLGLAGTRIGDAGLAHLGGLVRLEGLVLTNSRITDKGLLFLSGLSKLNSLEMTGCDLSEEAVQDLRKELPETEIINGVELINSGAL